MSVFSFLGNVGKGIGKGLLGVGKTAVNVAGNAAGIGNIIPNSNGGSVQAQVASINPQYPDGSSQQIGGRSLLGAATDALSGLGNWLNGRTHTQNDVNLGSGNRAVDAYNQSSGLPSWLLPAGIIGGVLLLLSGSSKKRRY